MSKNDKLQKRLFDRPKDFTYNEAKSLLESYGFIEKTKGKTSGSRTAFIRPSDKKTFYLHRPHPQNELKMYVVNSLIEFIEEIQKASEEGNDE